MGMRHMWFFTFAALAASAGCSSAENTVADEAPSGSLELALTAIPSDASCLRVVAKGGRTETRLFALTAGSSATFALEKLPVGALSVDGQAYNVACSAVGSSSVPIYVSEQPVATHIEPFTPANILLKLIHNGRASVSVDFESLPWISESKAPVDYALFGDTPYGAAQIADFPKFIADINAAAAPVSAMVHVGDIKNGSSRCDTSSFQFVLDTFNTAQVPLLYTPGDNEWTDCHRANNGAYDPLERLTTLRSLFFPVPGQSLGIRKKLVLSQSFDTGFETFVENALWLEAGTVFTLVHVVGSNNSLAPWYTDDTTGTHVDDPGRRIAEEATRAAAGVAWLDRSFALAKAQGAAALVVMMQANMWDGTPVNGFDSTVQKLAAASLDFGKPVLLIEGDSHVFLVDNPLAMGDAVHGVSTPVPNLTRVVVQGSTTAPLTEWLHLHVDPAASPPFSWTRNPR